MELSRGRAVFMDVDGTLLDCESFRLFLCERYFTRRVGLLPRLTRLVALRKLGAIDVATFKEATLGVLEGLDRSAILKLGSRFGRRLVGRVRGGAHRRLEACRRSGVPVYLVSASPAFYVEPMAARLDLAGALATELRFDAHDVFVGGFAGGECTGEEKARRVRDLARREGVDLERSVMFSDSAEDLPLLGEVGTPVAVWPDRRLASICRDRGWKIEYW